MVKNRVNKIIILVIKFNFLFFVVVVEESNREPNIMTRIESNDELGKYVLAIDLPSKAKLRFDVRYYSVSEYSIFSPLGQVQ